MLKTIVIAENALDPETWKTYNCEDVRAFLITKFDKFPDTARIYNGNVSLECDVTPCDEAGIKKLGELEGPFFVVVYPGEGVTVVVAVIAVLALAVSVYLLKTTEVPDDALRNTNSESPNNSFSQRQNSVRLNGRIPDIYGQVRSTPDLVAVPYTVFEDHREVEYTYMCIGQGEFEVLEDEVKDGTTNFSDISEASVEVYGPNTSPNSEDTPQLAIGDAINTPIYSIVRSNSVNGQRLTPLNEGTLIGNENMTFPIYLNGNGGVRTYAAVSNPFDFTNYFEAGDEVYVTNGIVEGTKDGSPVSVDLSGGPYVVTSVSKTNTIFYLPYLVNSQWIDYANLDTVSSDLLSPTISLNKAHSIGPFVLDLDKLDRVFCNFVASGGCYKDNGTAQSSVDVSIRIELKPINDTGVTLGPSEFFYDTLRGSSRSKSSRALTMELTPSFNGRCEITAIRTSDRDFEYEGTVVDEVKWRDCYAAASLNVNRNYTFDNDTEGFVGINGGVLSQAGSAMTVTKTSTLEKVIGLQNGSLLSLNNGSVLAPRQ